jgi:hypothetical protein
MKQNFTDITSRISTPPLWFDVEGFPRYDPFHPSIQSNIYADEAVLLKIECQGCGHPFDVCITSDRHFRKETLEELVKTKQICYHDPPNIGCCAAGPTMNSIEIKVLEFWKRVKHEWTRIPELEIEFEQDDY